VTSEFFCVRSQVFQRTITRQRFVFIRLLTLGTFRKILGTTNQIVSLQWESVSNRSYHIEASSNLTAWPPLATNLTATGANFTFNTSVPGNAKLFRVYRVP
jgi:hypothetical protein